MTHEFDGEKYRQVSAHQKEWGARLIAELALTGRERILDLGCGDGALTASLAALVPDGQVTGVDASRGMIDAAREHAADNLRFELMDINDLDLAGPFDLVFSNATLHWVKDHRRLLDKTMGLLAGGGTVRFNFAGDGNCAHFFRVIRDIMAWPQYAPYFAAFDWPWFMPTVDDYRALVAAFPFADARVWGENADRHFPDAEALTGWIDQPSIVPFLACVDAPDKSSFRDAVVERMIAETLQDDGTYFETFRRINLLARK